MAVLAIIAIPNIMNLFNQAKKNAFENELKSIYNVAHQQWMKDNIFESEVKQYARTNSTNCTNQLQLSGRSNIEYYIKVNKAGNVIRFKATDGTYQYSYSGGGLNIENIQGAETIAKLDPNDKISITCTVTPPATVSFANDSWTTIAQAVDAGEISKYNVGDTKTLTVSSTESYTVRIANTSTPQECSRDDFSQTACGFVVEVTVPKYLNHMNDVPFEHINDQNYALGQAAKGGWEYSSMRANLNNIYNRLPTELKKAIINTKVVSGHASQDSNNFVTNDKLYLLSLHEIYEDVDGNPNTGISHDDSAYNNTRQLDYYSQLNVTTSANTTYAKKGTDDWWLRSAYLSYPTHFYQVSKQGGLSHQMANLSESICFAFRLG